MRILFLTISDQQHHSLHKYVDLHCTFDFTSWEDGFRTIYPDVHIFDYYTSFVTSGPIAMENSIRNLVRENNIQLLIVPNMYYELAPSFLNELRNDGCKSLGVFFDDTMRFEATTRFYLSSFDYYLAHDYIPSKSLYKPCGIEAIFFPVLPSHSFYKEIIQKLDKADVEATNDVVFVGAKIADRNVFISYLKNNDIDIAVFGKGWPAGMLPTKDMLAIFNSSKISLNFIKTIDGSGRIQFKARIFEIIMAGGFVLSEYCDELTNYFDIGRDIDTFESPQELSEKIKFYLEHSDLRKAMAARAKDKIEKNYSFESNWSKCLIDIKKGRIKSQYPNPGYEVSEAAIKAFTRWNFPLIYGRCMLGEFRLAFDQYKSWRRELEGLNCGNSITKEFLKCVIRRFVRIFSNC